MELNAATILGFATSTRHGATEMPKELAMRGIHAAAQGSIFLVNHLHFTIFQDGQDGQEGSAATPEKYQAAHRSKRACEYIRSTATTYLNGLGFACRAVDTTPLHSDRREL